VYERLTRSRRDLQEGAALGTFHAFTNEPLRRIDWVLVPAALGTGRATTRVTEPGEAMTSDHFPILAEVEFTPPTHRAPCESTGAPLRIPRLAARLGGSWADGS
jgi:hypothetical protein